MFFTYTCVYKYVLVLGKLMQLWELFSYFFYCHWQSLKPFEMQPRWLVLYKKQGEGISVCQMEKDKTGVMICCNHAAKPTTVNYCSNNLLPVSKGSSPGLLVSLLLTFQFLRESYLCDPQHCVTPKLLGGQTEKQRRRPGGAGAWLWAGRCCQMWAPSVRGKLTHSFGGKASPGMLVFAL